MNPLNMKCNCETVKPKAKRKIMRPNILLFHMGKPLFKKPAKIIEKTYWDWSNLAKVESDSTKIPVSAGKTWNKDISWA